MNGTPPDDPAAPPAAGSAPRVELGEAPRSEAAGPQMGFLDHLAELRRVLIHSFLAALAATILCWFWSDRLLDILIAPIAAHGVYFTAPNEAFMTRVKISLMVGLFVVLPFILYRVYGFIVPALYTRERRVVTPLLAATTLLFYLGVGFGFLVVIPQVIDFMLGYGTALMTPLIGVGAYFKFVTQTCLAFGLVFELPVVILFLTGIGLVDPKRLLRTWRYAVVLIVFAAAVLTPPDVISQIMMAAPILVLYMGSVLLSLLVSRRRRKQD